MIRKTTFMTALAAAGLVLGACDSPMSTSGDARVTVLLTDAPHEYLDAAVVNIGRIELLPVDGPPVVITTDGGTYDLLQLQDGVTAALGTATIEAGRYLEMRLIVTDASLTLADPYTYTDGSTTRSIHVPSGASSGIKIKLSSADGESGEGVEIRPGETTLVVDFDVSQNFVMQGNANTPAGIQGFLFTPVLRAVVDDVAGSIAGTVTAPEGVATEGLSVVAVREGAAEDDVPATTLVKEDGTFRVHFLAPGTYNVTVSGVPEGHTVNTVQVTVGDAQHVTDVELVIAAE
jgi:hypothetical protein